MKHAIRLILALVTAGSWSCTAIGDEQPVPDTLPTTTQPDEKTPKTKVDPEVYAKLGASRDGRVYAAITLKPLVYVRPDSDQSKSSIAEVQDAIMASFAPGDFELGYRDETFPLVVGYINAMGLDKLRVNQRVAAITLSKVEPEVHRLLKNSEDGGRVPVVMVLRPIGPDGAADKARQKAIKELQDEVLARFHPGDFQVVHKYHHWTNVTGYLTARGAARVETIPDVMRVGTSP